MSDQNKDRVRGQLITKFAGDIQGIWVIRGEDSNPDFGGAHHMPVLCYCSGKYEDIVEYALSLSGFFAWGAGGDITKITIKDIDSQVNMKLKEAEEEFLKAKYTFETAKKKLEKMSGAS